ncbi:MAG: S8 family peptidase [Actinomycetes bacterium]
MRIGSKAASGALAMLLLIALNQSTNFATAAGSSSSNGNTYAEFIVAFEPKVSRATSNKIIADAGGEIIRKFARVLNGSVVNGTFAKMLALAKNPNVLFVEENLEVSATAIQNSGPWGASAPWGLDRIDQQALPLSSTYDDGDFQGANSNSYVVDSGIDPSNTDFEGRVATGYDAVQDGLTTGDCNGHGTHVAGTIGSRTFGVAKQTNLIPVRVLGCDGSGYYSWVIAGLNWIAGNYSSGDVAVVNMSLGGPTSSALDEAVSNLISRGISVVIAAGNDNLDACDYSPARTSEAITVGATNSDDSRASYSNYGTCLDIFAPGTAIESTWLGTSYYAILNGTSMAAPHVAGIIVRFLSQYPGLTPTQVANSIKTSSTKNLVTSAGTGSPNRLAYLTVLPDTTNVSLSVAGSARTVSSRELITISAVSNVAGKITFKANGKPIPGCKGVRTVALTATCQWKSSVKGTNQLSAKIIPTVIAENEAATSTNYSITVSPRTGPRYPTS